MSQCKIINVDNWVFYLSNDFLSLNNSSCGKWMYFFNDASFAKEICKKAIEEGVCVEAKHSNSSEGVCCFYNNGEDDSGHHRIIDYFIRNNLIRKTKSGRYYNISYKYDIQTNNGKYGESFEGELKLDQFIDLSTGKWKREISNC